MALNEVREFLGKSILETSELTVVGIQILNCPKGSPNEVVMFSTDRFIKNPRRKI